MTILIEPAGWGPPGTIRHAEAIGHGVWMAEHPKNSSDEKSVFTQALPPADGCVVATCCRPAHELWEMCEDADGHAWFAEEGPR